MIYKKKKWRKYTKVVRIKKQHYDYFKRIQGEKSLSAVLEEIIEKGVCLQKPKVCYFCNSEKILYGRSLSSGYVLCLKCGLVKKYLKEIMMDIKLYENPWLEERKLEIKNLKEKLTKKFGEKCCHCGTKGYMTLDHIIPQLFNGSDDEENLQLLCPSCNSAKGIGLTEYEL